MATYDSPSYVDADTFTVAGDHTSGEGGFDEGRALRMDCGVDGVRYGAVESASYSNPDTTVNLDAASDAITANLEEVITSPVRPGDEGNWARMVPRLTTLTKTDDYALTTGDLGKSMRMNASAAKTFTLPSVGAGDDGKRAVLVKQGAGALTVEASDSDIIVISNEIQSAEGGQVTCYDGEAGALVLEYVHAIVSWVVAGASNKWTVHRTGVEWNQSTDTWTAL